MKQFEYKGKLYEFDGEAYGLWELRPYPVTNKKLKDELILKLYSLFKGRKSPHKIPVKAACKAIGLHPNAFKRFWTKHYVKDQIQQIGLQLATFKPGKYRKYGRWNYPPKVQVIKNIRRPVTKPDLEAFIPISISTDSKLANEIVGQGLIPSEDKAYKSLISQETHAKLF